jgi:hypothetical protein
MKKTNNNSNTTNTKQKKTLSDIKNKLDVLLQVKKEPNEYKMNLPRDPVMFRKIPKAKVVTALKDFHNLTRSRYLYSMIHPDVAVTEGLQVKLYSDVPIPTSSIGFRQVYQLSTSDLGTFALTWTPNFLATQESLATALPIPDGTYDFVDFACSNFTYANNSFDGTTNNAQFKYKPMYVPNIGLQKYRLVSAIMKVKYNGSVLNQSGTMMSCATFDSELPQVACGVNTTRITAEGALQRFTSGARSKYGNFDLVRNGLWNYSNNITADANGLECLYVPIDPASHQFYPCCTFYGDEGKETIIDHDTVLDFDTGIREMTNEQGATLSYVVAGHNLPPSANCVFVEIFYNFEVIADPNAAPILRSSINNALDYNDHRRLTDLWGEMAKGGMIRGLLPPASENKWINFANKTMTWGKKLWPIVSKLI